MATGGLSRDFDKQVAEESDLGDHGNLHFNTDTLKYLCPRLLLPGIEGWFATTNAQYRTEAS